nr:DNA polymerase I [Lachnospiraceae bacterium]
EEFFAKRTFNEANMIDSAGVSLFYTKRALICLKAAKVLKKLLEEAKMEEVMNSIEMPLTYVLYDMEKEGVTVKRDKLEEYSDSLKDGINELHDKIIEQAGEDFNINSPKQLAHILYEKLGIVPDQRKKNMSTAADVLEKLAYDHEIVKNVLEYRTLTKLHSTYGEGLKDYIGSDGKIHTNFNQTITATGRISSTEPNLQNIPMRTELGRKIRKVFVPRKGYTFVDADYSQIELRILAHMSGDKKLIDAYKTGLDIHRITASQVFNIPIDEVTDEMRRNAKAVNFGIVYGISSFGLSNDLSIGRKEAKEYIEKYYETYPTIKEYLELLVDSTRKTGYSYTLFGRRRQIPEISSSKFNERSMGERMAKNSPIQGTAADIMKIAMIKVFDELEKNNLKSKMILQVHDELLIETALDEVDKVKQILKDSMEQAADLSVDLIVSVSQGNDWYEAK